MEHWKACEAYQSCVLYDKTDERKDGQQAFYRREAARNAVIEMLKEIEK